MSGQQRPWCLPCRQYDGSEVWASQLGVVCEWHWGILSNSDQQALADAVRAHHPRGGRVHRVAEQVWVVRVDLRRGDNTVEKTWAEEWEAHQWERVT